MPGPGTYGIDVHKTFLSSARNTNAIKWIKWNDPAYINSFTWEEYSANVIIGESVRFIEEHKDDPFYLHVWTRIPHAPVDSTPEQIAVYDDLVNPAPDAFPSWMGDYAAAADDFDSQLRNYMASVTYLDSQIGVLLDALDQHDLATNTVVVFSSDNGPESYWIGTVTDAGMGYPGVHRGRKRDAFEGGCRVPLIVRWPGHVATNAVNTNSVISAADYLPTVCAAAGIALPPDMVLDGENMLDVITGASGRSRTEPLLWHMPDGHPVLAIRDGDFKVLVSTAGAVDLYDMVRDPEERTNLVADAAYLPVAQQMTDCLLDWFHEEMPNRTHPDIDPQIFISDVVQLAPALSGMSYAVYLGTNWTELPDFDALTPVATGSIARPQANAIAPRSNDYGCVFQGYIDVDTPGIYEIRLASNDGSAFYLWDHLLIDNDGVHPVRSLLTNSVYLQEGAHPFRLEYFQHLDGAFLKLRWTPPGGMQEDVPEDAFFTTIPVAVDDEYTVEQGSRLHVLAPESVITANDNGAITVVLARDVSHGDLFLNRNGSFSYTPDIGFSGSDYYTYRATDGIATSAPARVVFRVNPASPSGLVPRYYWLDVPGLFVIELIINERYPDQPDGATFLNRLLAVDWDNPGSDNRFGDNYGQMIEGFIEAPETGDYTFWVAADRASEFLLSDSMDVSGALTRAYNAFHTYQEEWDAYPSQKSLPIPLTAGQRYYFRWLHKEADTTAIDHARVGWARPGEPTDMPSEVVPGSVLYPYYRVREPEGYREWIELFYPAGGDISLPSADPDADGFSNLAEFALLLIPTVPDFNPMIVHSLARHAGRISWSATIRSNLPQGTVNWESSPDLEHWDIAAEGVNYDVVSIQDNGNGSSTITYVLSQVPLPARFWRFFVR